MEIHFYESMRILPEGKYIIHDWEGINSIWEDIHANWDSPMKPFMIHTTQMCMLSNTWILAGYRMFVHQDNGIVYEITIKSKDNNDSRAVRIAQNVYAMWASNVFRG